MIFLIEKPAIDRLLDYISSQESRKPAIDILIQEYLEKIGSPFLYASPHISPLMDIGMFLNAALNVFIPLMISYLAVEPGSDNKTNTCSQQTQTPTGGMQCYQTALSFYPTPLTSGNDIMYEPNYDYRNTASTPLLPYVYEDIFNVYSFFY